MKSFGTRSYAGTDALGPTTSGRNLKKIVNSSGSRG